MALRHVLLAVSLFTAWGAVPSSAGAQEQAVAATKPPPDGWCSRGRIDVAAIPPNGAERVVCADVVALDQMLVYNRFGSFNPFGMIYALRRDVVQAREADENGQPIEFDADADACGRKEGTEWPDLGADLDAGKVRLKDCKRPRPLTLRANVRDVLVVRLSNLLRPQPDVSRNFCRPSEDTLVDTLSRAVRAAVSFGDRDAVDHGEAMCRDTTAVEGNDNQELNGDEWPASRGLNFSIQGLTAIPVMQDNGNAPVLHAACKGLEAVARGGTVTCAYLIDREGPYFFASNAAPAGGEGDGGSITNGLFGAVIAEQRGTSWFRSQLTECGFAKTFRDVTNCDGPLQVEGGVRHQIDIAKQGAAYLPASQLPSGQNSILPILQRPAGSDANAFEIVHSDLNAIVHRAADSGSADPELRDEVNFREFSVFFHDELKSFYTRNFDELGKFGEGQLAGVRDGFAINYGASGMGAALLANRKGIGPAANCQECLYEEFFLTSWANGDPALLEQFSDDPSNVHHSYLNDRIVFRNFHAGPKETHVFHLHAHQWFTGNDPGRGSYLDSQTVAPQQGFTYDIYGGGMELYRKGANGQKGWFDTLGSGNRNRTVGDSIFHCHLYPHFAQGMWELWRVHDVLEDGTRKLPDGQVDPGLSLVEEVKTQRDMMRPGSVDPRTGRWIASTEGESRHVGTPIPGLVPLPTQALPLLPTYEDGDMSLAEARGEVEPPESILSMPGYPFYVGGQPGHRPPQAPNDIALKLNDDGEVIPGTYLDGGLPRHVLTDKATRETDVPLPEEVVAELAPLTTLPTDSERREREKLQSKVIAKSLAMGDLTAHLKTAEIKTLPHEGNLIEKTGMGFHFNGEADEEPLKLRLASGASTAFIASRGGYGSDVNGPVFTVNGSPPKPGAPYADPCGAPSGLVNAESTDVPWSVSVKDGNDLRKLRKIKAAALARLTDADPNNDALAVGDLEDVGEADRPYLAKWRNDHRAGPRYAFVGAGDAVQIFGGPRELVYQEDDPFLKGTGANGLYPFAPDPAVIGYRRYEGSAVQLNLVTNRAGWHDPQARINVLTKNSDRYKERFGEDAGGEPLNRGRISPRVSASEEPFFFRALSGECIEYRHTNELPKELALDDFQVKTPTDTIGQHIHLVKFDVTSSDGSGNGFNYEDGTLAPDEIAARICAAKNEAGSSFPQPNSARLSDEILEAQGLCVQEAGVWKVSPGFKDIWKRQLSAGENRNLFQTTVQRWFADPILSNLRDDATAANAEKADRTLRTVFSHDHFGPSSIQQHGFYTALVIEPQSSQTCLADSNNCTPKRSDRGLIVGDDIDVGTKRIIRDPEALDKQSVEYREFALAIADFATLYDPRDSETRQQLVASFGSAENGNAKGMATLYCEALYASNPRLMEERCGSGLQRENGSWFSPGGDTPPAWVAGGMQGDSNHASDSIMDGTEAGKLLAYLVEYRRAAAGYAKTDANGRLAKPVAAPARPESISVDHHDPYLLNYFGEPMPLRIGTNASNSPDCQLKPLGHWVTALQVGVTERCSITNQRTGEAGDMANVFLSPQHGDPVTPIMEAYTADRVQFRMIQGAQEVQHNFTLEGNHWTRNIDQRFPSMGRSLQDNNLDPTLRRACLDERIPNGASMLARSGRAGQYHLWLRNRSVVDAATGQSVTVENVTLNADDVAFWQSYGRFIANCFNAEGRITSQEIGISEHFELAGAYRNDMSGTERAKIAPELSTLDYAPTPQVGKINNLTPSDTLQHFGSVDSLWNGAWGLLRVYKDKRAVDGRKLAECAKPTNVTDSDAAADLLECLESRPRIGERLVALDNSRAANGEAPGSFVPDMSILQCKPGAPVVHASAVAIEAREVFGSGTGYGGEIYDNDGLFLALIDTRKIAGAPQSGPVDDNFLSSPGLWNIASLGDIKQAIKDSYARPEPFVLTVNAGDCVKLTVVNALKRRSGGLRDSVGDAPMPRIVPLNTDSEWEQIAAENAPANVEQERTPEVRPSARFSLLLPLPTMNHQQLSGRPFGYNATSALAGINEGANGLTVLDGGQAGELRFWDARRSNIEQLTFYAGRVGVPTDFDAKKILLDQTSGLPAEFLSLRSQLLEKLEGVVYGRYEGFLKRVPSDAGIRISEAARQPSGQLTLPFSFQGIDYEIACTSGADCGEINSLAITEADRQSAQAEVAVAASQFASRLMTERLHFIPYAFGALPVKSAGDMVGHPLSGLIGSINVIPERAVLHGANAVVALNAGGPVSRFDLTEQECAAMQADNPRACTVSVASAGKPPAGTDVSAGSVGVRVFDVQPFAAQTPGRPATNHKVREFTLFWQDGLNLRDSGTKDIFRGKDGRVKMIADCQVCNDSYDLGDEGVSYRSAPFNVRLRAGSTGIESHYNLNPYKFGPNFFALGDKDFAVEGGVKRLRPQMQTLRAEVGEEVVIHVVHPGGRARQRAFVTIGLDYDDLFPSFGFPHSALLGPGKALTASLTKTMSKPGCFLWHDGPTTLWSGGAWGLLDVVEAGRVGDPVTSCKAGSIDQVTAFQ